MKKIILCLSFLLTSFIFMNGQVLGNGGSDSTQMKNILQKEPKAELKAESYNPNNGANQNPTDKKVEPQPELAPTGKPKLED